MDKDLEIMAIIGACFSGCLLALIYWHYFGLSKPEIVIVPVYKTEKDVEE